MKIPEIMAHRGASFEAPENTMPAFQLAIDQGADGIELDVHMTSDGVPVVIHDETADRTGTLSGRILDGTFDSWQKADFGSWKGEIHAGAKLPSLAAVLDLLKDWHGRLNIELKTDAIQYEGLEAEVIRLVRASGRQKRTLFSSFHHPTLARCHQLDDEIELAVLLTRNQRPDLPALCEIGVTAIHPDVRSVTATKVRKWHQGGFKVRPYTVDQKPLLLWLALCRVDAIITNRPAYGKAFLRRWTR